MRWSVVLLIGMLLVAAWTTPARAGWIEHVQQRVQDNLHREGISLSKDGYALELTETSTRTVRIRLTRADGGEGPERTLQDLPADLDAAATEVGIAVVSMLPPGDPVAPPPRIRRLDVKSADTPAVTNAEPGPIEPGARITDSDRYYLGLAFSLTIGFGSGQFVTGAPRGWLYAVIDVLALGAGTAGSILVWRRNDLRDVGIGLIVGGAVTFVMSRLGQFIDLLLFDQP